MSHVWRRDVGSLAGESQNRMKRRDAEERRGTPRNAEENVSLHATSARLCALGASAFFRLHKTRGQRRRCYYRRSQPSARTWTAVAERSDDTAIGRTKRFPINENTPAHKSGVALRFPPQSMTRLFTPNLHQPAAGSLAPKGAGKPERPRPAFLPMHGELVSEDLRGMI